MTQQTDGQTDGQTELPWHIHVRAIAIAYMLSHVKTVNLVGKIRYSYEDNKFFLRYVFIGASYSNKAVHVYLYI